MKNYFSTLLGKDLITITKVATATGISRATLTAIYYRRERDTKLSTLIAICDYLQVPLSELIEYDPRQKGSE